MYTYCELFHFLSIQPYPTEERREAREKGEGKAEKFEDNFHMRKCLSQEKLEIFITTQFDMVTESRKTSFSTYYRCVA